jgi:hypothetical protein
VSICKLQLAGGAFNPARVFGPALLNNEWNAHWVYWLADLTGAALAVGMRKLYMYFFENVHVTTAEVLPQVENQLEMLDCRFCYAV